MPQVVQAPQQQSPSQSPKKKGGLSASKTIKGTELIDVTEDGERVGVIVKRPDYLSNFTIDKDKMDFFT